MRLELQDQAHDGSDCTGTSDTLRAAQHERFVSLLAVCLAAQSHACACPSSPSVSALVMEGQGS